MENSCACIIPFYNEGSRLLTVLKPITQIKEISQIICVDDGSEQSIKKAVAKKYPNIIYLRSNLNQGKSEAIYKGLKIVKNNYVFLADADVQGLRTKEIQLAVRKIITNRPLDMIILRRINAVLESKWIRADTIFSGERILKKNDLWNICKTKPLRYQIEIAINKYMIDHHKIVRWMPSSAINVFKRRKIGLIKGTLMEWKMHFELMRFAGFANYLKQTLFFCRKRA